MKLDIPHLPYLHDRFTQAKEYYANNGVESRSVESDDDEPKNLPSGECGCFTRFIALPAPLKNIGLAARSGAGHFAAEIIVMARGKYCFSGISRRFAQALPKTSRRPNCKDKSELPLKWLQLNRNGIGYIVLGENTPVISISEQTKEEGRHIAIGDSGAEPRPVEENYPEFLEWMGLLQRVGTAYVNAIYQQRGTRLDKSFKELTLSLDCIV
jgi:hypothetical protein